MSLSMSLNVSVCFLFWRVSKIRRVGGFASKEALVCFVCVG